VTDDRVELHDVTRAVQNEHKVVHGVEQRTQILLASAHGSVGA
jgi:hypothetical protein